MMKCKLTMKERLALIGLLPTEQSRTVINQTFDLKKELAPSDEEIEEYKIRFDKKQSRWVWNPELAEKTKETEIPDVILDIVEKNLDELDKKGKFSEDLLMVDRKIKEE